MRHHIRLTVADTDGILRLFPSPFRTTVDVRHSQNGSLSFLPVGVEITEVEELLEVIDGVATTSKPIDSLTSFTYHATNLGAPTFVQGDRQLITPDTNLKYSLIKVVYNTKYIGYDVTGIPDLNVQFRAIDTTVEV